MGLKPGALGIQAVCLSLGKLQVFSAGAHAGEHGALHIHWKGGRIGHHCQGGRRIVHTGVFDARGHPHSVFHRFGAAGTVHIQYLEDEGGFFLQLMSGRCLMVVTMHPCVLIRARPVRAMPFFVSL